MGLPETTSKRGILNPHEGAAHFHLNRIAPARDLAAFVERHWIVGWDLRGREPYVSQVIPHPSVNLVVEPDGARVYGVATERFERRLAGIGGAVGTKFRPGGFFPFAGIPAAEITDATLPIADVFGPAGDALAERVLATRGDAQQTALVDAFLRERAPARDPNVELIAWIVRKMLDEPHISRVDDLARRHGMSTRSLQRLFRTYVGVSPKWVLQRYRLHEAAERMADGEHGDWAALALELGYFDQAHFIKDFKALVGRSPAEYAADQAAAAQIAA
jgi:AraC-like DNA-binding protein